MVSATPLTGGGGAGGEEAELSQEGSQRKPSVPVELSSITVGKVSAGV